MLMQVNWVTNSFQKSLTSRKYNGIPRRIYPRVWARTNQPQIFSHFVTNPTSNGDNVSSVDVCGRSSGSAPKKSDFFALDWDRTLNLPMTSNTL